MSIAECINCGNLKTEPTEVCSHCGFVPRSAEETVKSIILSTQDIGDMHVGKSKDELLRVAPVVIEGNYRFDEAEVQRLVAAYAIARNTSLREVLSGIFWERDTLVLLVALLFALLMWLLK